MSDVYRKRHGYPPERRPPMPEPITSATAAMADAHDALRSRATPDLVTTVAALLSTDDALYLITLANDDAAMRAAVRERDRLDAFREAVSCAVFEHACEASSAEEFAHDIEAALAALNPGGDDA